MDGMVNEFFNEIDQIAPPKEEKTQPVWKECYDNSSGYTYYWNMKTDEVTWEMPIEYKESNNQKNTNSINPNRTIPSTLLKPNILHRTITECEKIVPKVTKLEAPHKEKNTESGLITSNQNEERIVLISPSYDSESETEAEKEKRTVEVEPKNINGNIKNTNLKIIFKTEEINEDCDIISSAVDSLVNVDTTKNLNSNNLFKTEKSISSLIKSDTEGVGGFSLVAGYGDSEEEEEDTKTLTISEITETKVSHSPLFPISKPIDINQFIATTKEDEKPEPLNTKILHRKRRIGIELENCKLSPNFDLSKHGDVEQERQGLGFKSESEAEKLNIKYKIKAEYPGFKSGGLMFVKSDVSKPLDCDKKDEDTSDSKNNTMNMVEDTRKILNEKLNYLSEGHEPTSPVQVMIIKIETLYEAMKAGALTVTYLHEWLKETCSELVKLEKDAAPNGWLLQWDRVNKRYYYRNQQTGESQWDYPQPDVVRTDEAMDISTTPPPPIIDDVKLDPPNSVSQPVVIPPPPPAPIISKVIKSKKKPIEPLPPGVDLSEVTVPKASPPNLPIETPPDSTTNDKLGTALDSFYSDLAALETKVPISNTSEDLHNESVGTNIAPEVPTKKKKKAKVKLVEGLAMKKKGVSKLVERWKSVQKDYNQQI